MNDIILYGNDQENINNLVNMNEITKDKNLVLSLKEILMLIDNINLDILYIDLEEVEVFKSKLYSCFMNLKKEFKFNDVVNEYLDMYYSKIVKTILYFGLNNKLEFLVGRDDTIIV